MRREKEGKRGEKRTKVEEGEEKEGEDDGGGERGRKENGKGKGGEEEENWKNNYCKMVTKPS